MPKIAEVNTICREVHRENVFYEPEIVTEVLPDGSKLSRVVVRVYPDRNNRDESGQIPWDTFTDKVYFDVKEVYEDAEEKNFVIDPASINPDLDGETFGWALTDSWQHLGNVYYFLLSIYNLIETSKDDSPVIDTKGNIQGKLNYSVALKVLDVDRKTELNMLEFETLNELIGKNIQMTIELKKAHDLPEKYSFKTMAKYHWQDEEYETKVVNKKTTPDFSYAGVHTFTVTDDMIQSLLYNTLTISLYGMIESKKGLIKAKN